MQNLIIITERNFNDDAEVLDESQYTLREAVRAVLLDSNGHVYLMNVSKHDYHKLPGGGIDERESKEDALARELKEEVGCKAAITQEVGQITEYRNFYNYQKQISYCYIAEQVGKQGKLSLEQGELDEGMVQIKALSIAHAIRLIEKDKPNNLEGQFIQKRDLAFLKQALKMLNFRYH